MSRDIVLSVRIPIDGFISQLKVNGFTEEKEIREAIRRHMHEQTDKYFDLVFGEDFRRSGEVIRQAAAFNVPAQTTGKFTLSAEYEKTFRVDEIKPIEPKKE